MVYGRQVRGPLDVLRETWEEKEKSPESVVSYVSRVHDRLATTRDIAHSNQIKKKQEMKTWYDQTARQRSLDTGDQVLVLLPS